ncbi:Nitrite reductase [NAD(P)H] [Cytospora paraplurivora]|uniref:Nitrite reductase [NAD(P)H] n=1 Tax=Cytospora paraplurivora TaxID=2898453 RepID=A0AAN9UHZ5_9PEZI
MASDSRQRIVVVGLGMVGIAFIEKLLKHDVRTRSCEVTVIGEEPHLAYNRVGLTSFFGHRKPEQLYLNPLSWYEANAGPDKALGWHLNSKVAGINRDRRIVACADGSEVPYDILVLATGSEAVLPRNTPGFDADGVFVYRNISDLERLIEFSATKNGTYGAVVGGGLLGLEAAKAMMDLECFEQVKIIERNRWVLSRQLDGEAGSMVVEQVRSLGVDVMLNTRVARIDTDEDNHVKGVNFENGDYMPCSTICFAIGVKARDELAKQTGLDCAERGGGIVVDDQLRTSDANIYAIGECASWQGQTFGLIGPGVEMADVLAFNLTQAKMHTPRAFKRPDVSTKLKLLGVDVASFGDFFADRDGPKYLPPRAAAASKRKSQQGGEVKDSNSSNVKALTYKDPFRNVYKKYIFTADGKYLLGGMMIGDTQDYVKLVPLVKKQKELEVAPAELILGSKKSDDGGADDLDDDTQICSCHNVIKGDIVNVVKDGTCKSIGDVKSCTKAGTGCGGCVPLVQAIFNKTMADMGNEIKNNICPHFNYSRADLYNIVMVKRLKTFAQVMKDSGVDADSVGCEVCKPAVGSIFASLWNKHVMDRPNHGLQDTNDRFLGNIQRNGTFSVIPRVSAGEITPDKLIVMGEVASKYGLYTKITGGQRIDMFGAKKHDLLEIWKTLIDAGMECGHAYAKSLRTVKSCVGTTWCRYGIGDSVGMAVRLEERYKSIRAPHKLKGGVSGCVRECAEAQSKDFGLIATEKGFNILVAGNGGASPKHTELLAKDVPPTEVIPILDRYLMFYMRTADRLQRTARWLEALPGGIKYLREVILDDKLGINASLEAQMAELVDSYFDEWAEAVNNPAIAAKFKQFNNTDEKLDNMDTEEDRGQSRPVYWAKEPAKEDFRGLREKWSSTTWQPVIGASHFDGADALPNGISAAIKRGDTQLAVWRIRGRYYATQQMCPHKRAFVLSDGLVGEDAKDSDGGARAPSGSNPWISCPHHKRNYDLGLGSCKNDSELSIATFEVEERPDGLVYLRLPPVEELDAALGTSKWKVKKGEGKNQFEELDRKIQFKGHRARKPGVNPHVELPMRKPVELMAGGASGMDW